MEVAMIKWSSFPLQQLEKSHDFAVGFEIVVSPGNDKKMLILAHDS